MSASYDKYGSAGDGPCQPSATLSRLSLLRRAHDEAADGDELSLDLQELAKNVFLAFLRMCVSFVVTRSDMVLTSARQRASDVARLRYLGILPRLEICLPAG